MLATLTPSMRSSRKSKFRSEETFHQKEMAPGPETVVSMVWDSESRVVPLVRASTLSWVVRDWPVQLFVGVVNCRSELSSASEREINGGELMVTWMSR